eukprot:431268-Prorocentrum_lima.AAC.1
MASNRAAPPRPHCLQFSTLSFSPPSGNGLPVLHQPPLSSTSTLLSSPQTITLLCALFTRTW